ncbi:MULTISPECIES: hypothetical protein [Hafniaceae]|uniref:hypothetical protein n=1 Tax=Hafniaceae TaxID=1903412 RepID=UPI00061D13C2|nr:MULTISPECIES: hypothetical protein [Hafniaceae]KKF38521.1 hypothetical protein PU01_22955 [Hafnia alvei]MBW3478361.1 hypothetical protein [Hafnia alvei]MCE9871064.1 hypothetical protein [Hafnia alvei]MDX6842977.1 hypothetical protein [Hafnia paralvei]PNK70579.1 hypothetical protein A6J69_000255 [Hafnia paralvei]
MRKPFQEYPFKLDPRADYKEEYLYNKAKQNCESTTTWLYLGADTAIPTYAKIGITMGDLTSRSYSTARPTYYVFCGFKCRADLNALELAEIESCALRYLDDQFKNHDGTTKRVNHAESGRLSECFYDVDFDSFFVTLHDYLYGRYRRDFQVAGFYNYLDVCEGNFLLCEFNTKLVTLNEQNKYIRKVLR